MRFSSTEVSPKSDGKCPYKASEGEKTRKSRWCKRGDRSWTDVSANQETPKVASNRQNLEEVKEVPP